MSADNAEKQFIIGHKNRSLICDFVGEPKPEVTWEGPKTVNHYIIYLVTYQNTILRAE